MVVMVVTVVLVVEIISLLEIGVAYGCRGGTGVGSIGDSWWMGWLFQWQQQQWWHKLLDLPGEVSIYLMLYLIANSFPAAVLISLFLTRSALLATRMTAFSSMLPELQR